MVLESWEFYTGDVVRERPYSYVGFVHGVEHRVLHPLSRDVLGFGQRERALFHRPSHLRLRVDDLLQYTAVPHGEGVCFLFQ